MFSYFTSQLIYIIANARGLAWYYNCSYIGTEHILLAMVIDNFSFSGQLLRHCNFDPIEIEKSLVSVYDELGIVSKIKTKQLGTILLDSNRVKKKIDRKFTRDIVFSPHLLRIFKKAYYYAEERKDVVTPELLLIILLLRKNGTSYKVLNHNKISTRKILFRLKIFLSKDRLYYDRLFLGNFGYRVPSNPYFIDKFEDMITKIYTSKKYKNKVILSTLNLQDYEFDGDILELLKVIIYNIRYKTVKKFMSKTIKLSNSKVKSFLRNRFQSSKKKMLIIQTNNEKVKKSVVIVKEKFFYYEQLLEKQVVYPILSKLSKLYSLIKK